MHPATFLPSALGVPFGTESGGRGLSQLVWAKVRAGNYSKNGESGFGIGDDFLNISLTGGTAVSSNISYFTSSQGGQYKTYEDSTGVLGQSLTATGGVFSMATDGGDNDENWIQTLGGNVCKISHDTVADRKLTIFETRFQVSTVADDVQAIFLGLSEEARAVADQKADNTGVLADKDYIGFDTVHTNGGTTGTNAALNFVYNKASGSGPITAISAVQTLAASTWYKVGFVYDPEEPPARRLTVYVDGVANANRITETEINTSTDFPDGEMMKFLMGQKAGTTTAGTLLCDWWAIYQAG